MFQEMKQYNNSSLLINLFDYALWENTTPKVETNRPTFYGKGSTFLNIYVIPKLYDIYGLFSDNFRKAFGKLSQIAILLERSSGNVEACNFGFTKNISNIH